MRAWWRSFLLFSLGLVALSLSAGRHLVLPISGNERALVDKAIRLEMARQRIPGLSVALVTDRRLRWAEGFGVANVENRVPAGAETVYRIASISKAITAVAVLQLAEEGKLDIDAPIQRYVPSFPVKRWPITARQLLAHVSGVRGYRGREFNDTRHFRSVTESLTIFQDDPLEFEPGTRYAYTSYGYDLLGAMVESVSGERFEDYVRDHVFVPAGMLATRVDEHAAIIPRRASGYALRKDGTLVVSPLLDTSGRIPAGGFCSTAPDLARFAIAVQASRLLSPEVGAMMITPVRPRNACPSGYALGWQTSRYRGRREVWHRGAQAQVGTLLYMQPDRDFAVALTANLEGADLMELARTIADTVLPASEPVSTGFVED